MRFSLIPTQIHSLQGKCQSRQQHPEYQKRRHTMWFEQNFCIRADEETILAVDHRRRSLSVTHHGGVVSLHQLALLKEN